MSDYIVENHNDAGQYQIFYMIQGGGGSRWREWNDEVVVFDANSKHDGKKSHYQVKLGHQSASSNARQLARKICLLDFAILKSKT